ncbi:MAG: MOSC domain-containing protein [Bacteroidia bacterium]
MSALVADIFIYPIKSLGGFSVEEWPVMEEGLLHDRQWMLVDESGNFLTQRNLPQMALLKVQSFDFDAKSFEVFSSKTQSRMVIPTDLLNQNSRMVKVWEDVVNAFVYPDSINDWFSKELGFTCYLVKKDENAIRQVDRKYAAANISTSFSDGYPILVVSESSLMDLNKRLNVAVPMNRFRPNIVLSGTKAFEEDGCHELQFKEIRLNLVKPCARCIVTTINQDTAEKSPEPLRTLSTFRAVEHKILFGMNALVKTTGKIRRNEEVHLLQST